MISKFGSKSECCDRDDAFVLLLLSSKRCVGPGTGGDGTALPVMRIFLNWSTSMAGRGPLPFFCIPSPSAHPVSSLPSLTCCSPNAASLVAKVFANGFKGAPEADAPGTGSDCSEPELRRVFRDACSKSESAVAVEPESSSSSWCSGGGGGGGETRPEDSLRGSSSGDCGGDWMTTRLVVFFADTLLEAMHRNVSFLDLEF